MDDLCERLAERALPGAARGNLRHVFVAADLNHAVESLAAIAAVFGCSGGGGRGGEHDVSLPFCFYESAKNMLEARQTRLVGHLEPAMERRLAAASVGALLDKTMHLSGEVYTAMQARGFRGEIRLLNDLEMRRRDWWQLSALLAMALLAFGLGR